MPAFPWVLILAATALQVCVDDVTVGCGDQEAENRTLVATVFGNPLYLDQVTPTGREVEARRKALPQAEYDEWFRKFRGVRIYDKVWFPARRRYIEREKIGVTKEEMAAIAESAKRWLESAPEA